MLWTPLLRRRDAAIKVLAFRRGGFKRNSTRSAGSAERCDGAPGED